jgi:hypothetical protein
MKKIFDLLDFRKYPKKEKVHFFTNILIGIAIAVLFSWAEKTSLGGAFIDSMFDALILAEANAVKDEDSLLSKVYRKLSGVDIEEITSGYVKFVEIGRPVLEEWNAITYPVIPRDRTGELIEKISSFRPKVLVVDILYDTTGCKGDDVLVEKLRQVLSREDVKLIFPALIDQVTHTLITPYFYDELKKEFPDRVFVASFYFLSSRRDGISRFVNFYRFYIGENGEKELIWNVSVLAPALYFGSYGELEKLKEKILHGHSSHHLEVELGERRVEIINEDLVANRIRFVFPVTLDEKGRLSMRNLPVYVHSLDRAGSELSGRLVILGTTDPLRGDYHRTPVGNMPGMYVIGNAVYTVTHLQVLHEGVVLKWLIEGFVIVLAAYLFLWFNSLPATLLSIGIIFAGFPLVVYLFFKYNVFVNLIFPVIGIILHKSVADIEEFIEKGFWRKH